MNLNSKIEYFNLKDFELSMGIKKKELIKNIKMIKIYLILVLL